jgi:hypothetical protein
VPFHENLPVDISSEFINFLKEKKAFRRAVQISG